MNQSQIFQSQLDALLEQRDRFVFYLEQTNEKIAAVRREARRNNIELIVNKGSRYS